MGITLLIGAVLGVLANWRDQILRTTVLFCDLEEDAERSYRDFLEIFEQMAGCAVAWHIGAAGKVFDRKREAGATQIIQRKQIALRAAAPPLVSTNIPVPCIPAGEQTLYFFPDRLLVFSEEGAGAVNYKDLAVTTAQIRFIESEGGAEGCRSRWEHLEIL